MIKVENIEVWGFEHAIRGMRNPLNSWNKTDSTYCEGKGSDLCNSCDINPCKYSAQNAGEKYVIGPNDLGLMKRLFNSGPEHRKYLRQIIVSMDITAPLYWWKEFDTYKVGTVANSCSTMHKITSKQFTLDDFSYEHLIVPEKLGTIIAWLNQYRDCYLNWDENKTHIDEDGNILNKKDIWWQLIQLLPSSYNQKRTVTMNYENVFTMIRQRTGHKLDEWNIFVDILKTLPYVEEIADGQKN